MWKFPAKLFVYTSRQIVPTGPDEGQHVYIDNWYKSALLVKILHGVEGGKLIQIPVTTKTIFCMSAEAAFASMPDTFRQS
jgi:hypothetical protein